jgi:DNA polymerase I
VTLPKFDRYREIWLVDFEFCAPPGERPEPVCLVAREFRSGRVIRLWEHELRRRQEYDRILMY